MESKQQSADTGGTSHPKSSPLRRNPPGEAKQVPLAHRRDPSDVIVSRRTVMSQPPMYSDPEGYLNDCEAAAYYTSGEHSILSAEVHDRIRRRWLSISERMRQRGIYVAGPGTLCERWVRCVLLIVTLGLVTIECSACKGRKRWLDRLGWSGIYRSIFRVKKASRGHPHT